MRCSWGTGRHALGAEELCRTLELAGVHAVFTGYLPEDDTIDAYLASDLLVFPTYHQEGMPMVIFHSLSLWVAGRDHAHQSGRGLAARG